MQFTYTGLESFWGRLWAAGNHSLRLDKLSYLFDGFHPHMVFDLFSTLILLFLQEENKRGMFAFTRENKRGNRKN